MKVANSQEREDELKYLDLEEDDDPPVYVAAPAERVPWDWRNVGGVAVVTALAWLLLTALVLGLREEWRFIGRLFQ